MGTELVRDCLSRGTNQLGIYCGEPNVRGPYVFGTKCVTQPIIVPLIAGFANVVEKYRQNHSGLSIGQVNDSDNSDDSSDENDDQIPDIQNPEISIPKSVIIQPRTPPKNSSKSLLFEENRPSHLVESLRDLCKLSGMSEEERKYYCHLCSYANINQDEFIQHVSSHYNFRYDIFFLVPMSKA